MENSNVWEYLDNVWVLSGLVLVLFTGFLKLLPVNKLKSSDVAQLMHKGTNYLFILGLVGIVLGFLVFQDVQQKPLQTDQIPTEAESTQAIDNNTGTAINAVGDVHINQPLPPTQDRARSERSDTVNQQIENNSGIAINAGGDVSANISEE